MAESFGYRNYNGDYDWEIDPDNYGINQQSDDDEQQITPQLKPQNLQKQNFEDEMRKALDISVAENTLKSYNQPFKGDCVLCMEKNVQLYKSCGNQRCDGTMCIACMKKMTNVDKYRGRLVDVATVLCPYCRTYFIDGIHRKLHSISELAMLPENKMWTAWCINCRRICNTHYKRQCDDVDEGYQHVVDTKNEMKPTDKSQNNKEPEDEFRDGKKPVVENFVCDTCDGINTEERSSLFRKKNCPSCKQEMTKNLGSGECNRVQCGYVDVRTNKLALGCGKQVCFFEGCNEVFPDNRKCYDHMTEKHGSWYDTYVPKKINTKEKLMEGIEKENKQSMEKLLKHTQIHHENEKSLKIKTDKELQQDIQKAIDESKKQEELERERMIEEEKMIAEIMRLSEQEAKLSIEQENALKLIEQEHIKKAIDESNDDFILFGMNRIDIERNNDDVNNDDDDRKRSKRRCNSNDSRQREIKRISNILLNGNQIINNNCITIVDDFGTVYDKTNLEQTLNRLTESLNDDDDDDF